MAIPTRSCLACRQPASKAALVRLVVAGGSVVVDALARQPGRGAYLCPQPACVERALRRDAQALRRALRVQGAAQAVIVEPEVLRTAVERARGLQQEGVERTAAAAAARSDA